MHIESLFVYSSLHFKFMVLTLVKRSVLLLLPILFVIPAFCQLKTNPDQFIGLSVGSSMNGTGDMLGVAFNTVYSKKFRKRLSWIATFGGTLHDGSWDLFFDDPYGEEK